MNTSIYLQAVLMSFLLFWSLGSIQDIFPKSIQRFSSIAIAFLTTIIISAHFYVYKEFGDSFSYSMLRFSVDNPSYFLSFVKSYLLDFQSAWFLVPFTFYTWIWYPKNNSIRNVKIFKNLSIAVLAIILHFVLLNQLRLTIQGKRVSPDVALSFAIKVYARDLLEEKSKETLHPSNRIKLDKQNSEDKKYNVIVILNESWGKNGVWLYNGTNNCMPNLKAWIENEKENFTVFKNAFANSSATDVSVPSILTGVAPWESSKKLHSMPFLWNWAEASGYQTILVSSQFYNWGNLDNFCFCPGPKFRATADQTDLPSANDLGVDDLAMIEHFNESLSNANNQAFFAILQTNALHSPFQQKSKYLKTQANFDSKYENALFILDSYFNKLKDLLAKRKLLDNTIIVFTSDHGDYDKLIHKTARIVSYYDEIISIPFIIRTPDAWNKENPNLLKQMKVNSSKNISNIDLAPTLIDFFNYKSNITAKKLVGKSLLSEIDENRLIFALNTNEIRKWEEEGFAIIKNEERYIFSTLEGQQCFNISADPNELSNIYKSFSKSQLQVYDSAISANAQLKRIFNRKKA